MMRYLTPEQVLYIHDRLIAATGGQPGVRDLAMLESATGTPAKDQFPDAFTKAAALMEALINNRPFVDGNKRTGITAAALLLQINGYKLTATPADLEKNTLLVAQNRLSLANIADWLRQNNLFYRRGKWAL